MFYVTFNKINTVELDIKAIERHSLPIPSFKFKEIEAEGINGSYIEESENVKDIQFEISFNFLYENDDDFNFKKKSIKNWLRKVKDNKLSFSDNDDYYYRVKRLEVSNIEREINVATFEVKFICEGYEYSLSGCREISILSTGKNILKPLKNYSTINGFNLNNLLKNGVQYTVTNNKNQLVKIAEFKDAETFLGQSTKGKFTFTFDDSKQQNLYIWKKYDSQVAELFTNEYIDFVMIEEGTGTTFEPYKENKSYTVFNNGVKSFPILRVVGEGNTTITFNDKSFSLNVGQEVIVDSEEELCYKDGRIVTNIMSGKFPYLEEGKNTINWSGENIQIYLQTNLRDY